MNDGQGAGPERWHGAMPKAPPSATRNVISPPRSRRPRLAAEITLALLAKFLLLYLLWATWFSHPATRDLTDQGVAAALVGASRGPDVPAEARHDPGP